MLKANAAACHVRCNLGMTPYSAGLLRSCSALSVSFCGRSAMHSAWTLKSAGLLCSLSNHCLRSNRSAAVRSTMRKTLAVSSMVMTAMSKGARKLLDRKAWPFFRCFSFQTLHGVESLSGPCSWCVASSKATFCRSGSPRHRGGPSC